MAQWKHDRVIRYTMGLTAGLCCLLCAGASKAQLNAKLEAIRNYVKVSKNGGSSFLEAHQNDALDRGHVVVTYRASKADVRFSDKSLITIAELSRVVINTVGRQRDAKLSTDKDSPKTRAYGDYHGPGRFLGKHALCAVRGTQFEMILEPTKDIVRCFSGEIIVTSVANQLITGKVGTSGPQQISSDELVDNDEDWSAGKLVFLAGPNKGQELRVVNFNAATGTATLNAPLRNPNDLGSPFFIIRSPDAPYVILHKNEETNVADLAGAAPVTPYPTQTLYFAGGEEFTYTQEPIAGKQELYLQSFSQDERNNALYHLNLLNDGTQEYGSYAPGIQITRSIRRRPNGLNLGLGNTNGLGNGSVNVGIGNGNGNGSGNLIVNIGPPKRSVQTGGLFLNNPHVGDAAFTANGSDGNFFYANESAVFGKVFMSVGGRFGTLDRHSDNQLDQLMLRYRDRKLGDIQAGRFHWFAGPATNSLLGKFISFSTSDGILWNLPTNSTTHVQLAWFDKINPLEGPRIGGYAARVAFPASLGQVAFSTMTTGQKTIGGAMDVEYPLIPHRLQFYGEGGVDTSHSTMYSLGLFLPQLLQKYNATLALEYAYRGGFGNAIALDLHLPVTRYLQGILVFSKEGAQSFRPSVGVQVQF